MTSWVKRAIYRRGYRPKPGRGNPFFSPSLATMYNTQIRFDDKVLYLPQDGNKDMRDLTRAIRSLTKVCEALNENLVILGRRMPQTSPSEITVENPLPVLNICPSCERGTCTVGRIMFAGCSCCRNNHAEVPKEH